NPARALMSSLSPTGAPDTQPAATIPMDLFDPPLCGLVVGTTRVEDVGTGEDLIEAVFSGWKLPGEFSKKSRSLPVEILDDQAVRQRGQLGRAVMHLQTATQLSPSNWPK
ncbi:MAG TPA: hypothetical protein PLD03_05715, partial [Thiomonas arsenitoxydans]|nr:hypothetical protein [Thiomonas arsenitoxydans]